MTLPPENASSLQTHRTSVVQELNVDMFKMLKKKDSNDVVLSKFKSYEDVFVKLCETRFHNTQLGRKTSEEL